MCDNTCGRSVQGTLNQMAQYLEHMPWYDNACGMDLAPYRSEFSKGQAVKNESLSNRPAANLQWVSYP